MITSMDVDVPDEIPTELLVLAQYLRSRGYIIIHPHSSSIVLGIYRGNIRLGTVVNDLDYFRLIGIDADRHHQINLADPECLPAMMRLLSEMFREQQAYHAARQASLNDNR